MFGERHQPPSLPGMTSPNPVGGGADPAAMLAYAAAAYAQQMPPMAPQQHHAMTMYAPAASMPLQPQHAMTMYAPPSLPLQQPHAMPMHVPASAMAAYVPPPSGLPKKHGAATSRRAQAADIWPSVWTCILFLVFGVGIGIACARQSSPSQEQQSPHQQDR